MLVLDPPGTYDRRRRGHDDRRQSAIRLGNGVSAGLRGPVLDDVCRTPATRADSAWTPRTSISVWRSPRRCSRFVSSATSASGFCPIRCAATGRTTCWTTASRWPVRSRPASRSSANSTAEHARGHAADRHREPLGDADGRAIHGGPVRIDGALTVGITELDPTWGFTTGVTWVFKAFTVQ